MRCYGKQVSLKSKGLFSDSERTKGRSSMVGIKSVPEDLVVKIYFKLS